MPPQVDKLHMSNVARTCHTCEYLKQQTIENTLTTYMSIYSLYLTCNEWFVNLILFNIVDLSSPMLLLSLKPHCDWLTLSSLASLLCHGGVGSKADRIAMAIHNAYIKTTFTWYLRHTQRIFNLLHVTREEAYFYVISKPDYIFIQYVIPYDGAI